MGSSTGGCGIAGELFHERCICRDRNATFCEILCSADLYCVGFVHWLEGCNYATTAGCDPLCAKHDIGNNGTIVSHPHPTEYATCYIKTETPERIQKKQQHREQEKDDQRKKQAEKDSVDYKIIFLFATCAFILMAVIASLFCRSHVKKNWKLTPEEQAEKMISKQGQPRGDRPQKGKNKRPPPVKKEGAGEIEE